jgi:hypothetical protein
MARPTMLKRTRILWLLMLCATLAVSVGAQEASLGAKSTRQLHVMGQTWKLPVVETSVQGELMVKAPRSCGPLGLWAVNWSGRPAP